MARPRLEARVARAPEARVLIDSSRARSPGAGRGSLWRGTTGLLLDRWDAVRQSYWFVPGVMTAAAAAAALGLVELDRARDAGWGLRLAWLTDVSAPAARAVLSAVAGSMMTVTGVVFSITVVALTLTSSQFGPRLLRGFFRDRGSQLSLGAFLATFVFNLLVLRAVEDTERVPVLATAVAVLLAVLSLFVLIYFVHHAASSIQASSVIAAVAREIDEQLPVLFPEDLSAERAPGRDSLVDEDRQRLDAVASEGQPLRLEREGYLRVLDEEPLLAVACERDLLIRVALRPGDFVAWGSVVARVMPPGRLDEATAEQLCGAFLLGDHRTPVQDLGLLVDQLSEMAVRALSPGTNDPTTAIDCIRRLGSLVARLAGRGLPDGLLLDDSGRLRVVVDPIRFDEVLANSFDAVRRYGAHDAAVAVALLEALGESGDRGLGDARRERLREHVDEVRAAFESAEGSSRRDAGRVVEAWQRARDRLDTPGAVADLDQRADAPSAAKLG